MEERRRRIREDLAGLLEGEVRFDPLSVAEYASDASLFQIAPLGVVFPRSREDVVALARYAQEAEVPLVARGAGTGLAGQAIGEGLIVDFSRHMRRIERISAETVRVQPGVVRDHLNAALRPHGRYFPPDPSNTAVTTVGGMLGVDAAGSHSVRIGSTRDHVAEIETVLIGGSVLRAGTEPLVEHAAQDANGAPPSTNGSTNGSANGPAGTTSPGAATDGEDAAAKKRIVHALSGILADNTEIIDRHQPPLIRNCAGYLLRGIRREDRLHLARLLVGSEGTLGLFTAAELHTSPLPEHRGVVLLLFGQLEPALRAVQVVARQEPSACDLLDRRLLTLAREADPRFERLVSPAAEAALLVEHVAFSDAQVRERLRATIAAVQAVCLRTVVAGEAYGFDDVEFFWSLPSKVVPLLTRLQGETRPVPFVEDVAVPPEALHDFLVEARRIFQKHEVTATLYAHAAAGQLHLRPFLEATRRLDGGRLAGLAADLYPLVFRHGGTVSGEHGDGLSRTPFLPAQYGPLYQVFREIKSVFDPRQLLNPGKIVGNDPQAHVRHLRPPVEVPDGKLVELQLAWSLPEAAATAARCNGCGQCRTQQSGLRMCPFFRGDPEEETSPRAKVNVMRAYLSGSITLDDLNSADMRRLADSCFNCKQCRTECPTNVDVPRLMLEAKAHLATEAGNTWADWIVAHPHVLGSVGSTLSFLANWAIDNPVARWVFEQALGIHRQRKLPRFARRTFLSTLDSRLKSRPRRLGHRPLVAFFVDSYANYHDPELAAALVALFRHVGYDVYVPPEQTASGFPLVSLGELAAARELAARNIRAFADVAREGIPVVCTEPAAAVCLREEYPRILDHPDVGTVAAQVVDAGTLLARPHVAERLRRDAQPLALKAVYHAPCLLKAQDCGTPLADLLDWIPELRLHRIEAGCSGMAGTYGLTKHRFATSLRLGWPLVTALRDPRWDLGVTECSACKLQMEQGTRTPTLHPLKLLALACGLMPELRDRLAPSPQRLVVT